MRKRSNRSPSALLLGCLSAIGGCCDAPDPKPPIDQAAAPESLGQTAYDHVAGLVAMGPRHAGTKGWRNALWYIETELQRIGLEPEREEFDSAVAQTTFANVRCTIPGRSETRLVLACHHDTKVFEGHLNEEDNFHFVGANDSASGVGLCLSLAGYYVDHPPPLTIELCFFDGEESLTIDWNDQLSLFGSREYVRQHVEDGRLDGHPVRAMVLVDMVGADHLSFDDDQRSTPWLKRLFRTTARDLGLEHLVFRERGSIKDDHVPFLAAGIPSINLIDLYDNPEWHTPDDTLDHIRAESLQHSARLVLELIERIATRRTSL
ncbi:MAG: M28 family metallopeptidase [Planctomycetota bacterium]